MAKSKHKKRYPKLSKADRILFGSLETIVILILTVSMLFRIKAIGAYYLKQDNVLAYCAHMSSIWFYLPFILFIICIVITALEKATLKKHPIFGNKKVNYYDKDKYLFTLPLFDKRYSKEEIRRVRKLSKRQKRNIIIIASIGVVLYGLTFFGIYGRNMINTDSIERYNCVNELTASYSYDQVAECEIVSSPQTHQRISDTYSEIKSPEIGFVISFSDGKSMYFSNEDFGRNLNSMTYVKSKLANTKISYDDKYLDEFLQYYNFTYEEKQMITDLFD